MKKKKRHARKSSLHGKSSLHRKSSLHQNTQLIPSTLKNRETLVKMVALDNSHGTFPVGGMELNYLSEAGLALTKN